jgi:acyl transferase domain-containing protein
MSQNHTGSVAYAGLDNHTHGEEEDVLEPIAVVGMSLKFPGDADNEESFWEMMMEKHCATTEFPQDRLNSNAFYNSESSRLSTVAHLSVFSGGHSLTIKFRYQ